MVKLVSRALCSIEKGLHTVLQKERAELLPLEAQVLQLGVFPSGLEMPPPPESHLAAPAGPWSGG